MSPTPEREEALFQAVVFLNGPARAAFLDQACAGDAALQKRLVTLLAAHEATDMPLADEKQAARGTIKLEFTEEPPEEALFALALASEVLKENRIRLSEKQCRE